MYRYPQPFLKGFSSYRLSRPSYFFKGFYLSTIALEGEGQLRLATLHSPINGANYAKK